MDTQHGGVAAEQYWDGSLEQLSTSKWTINLHSKADPEFCRRMAFEPGPPYWDGSFMHSRKLQTPCTVPVLFLGNGNATPLFSGNVECMNGEAADNGLYEYQFNGSGNLEAA